MARCVDQSMGLVQSDAQASNLKVNNVAAINTLAAASSASQPYVSRWAQLSHGREDLLFFTVPGDTVGTYASMDTISAGEIFDVVEGDPIVQVEGAHSGQVRFLEAGTYQVTLYFEFTNGSVDETVQNDNALVCFDNTTPTTSTPNQLSLFVGINLFPNANVPTYTSGSLNNIITVQKDDVYQVYVASLTTTPMTMRIPDVRLAINSVQ